MSLGVALLSITQLGAVPDRKPLGQTGPVLEYTNSIGMKFVWIAPGTFLMGSPKEELERRFNEPQHQVTLTKGFYMSVHLVTQEQWQAVMKKNPSYFKGEKNLPVEQVAFNDCLDFCKILRIKEEKRYRLPTEAEWEYTCRARTTTAFHFGNAISTDQANYFGLDAYGKGKPGVNRAKTTPVDTFKPNAWGLHDMHGNVWQWCSDWYEDYPRGAIDPQGPEPGAFRVQRGGTWGGTPSYCRSACRNPCAPDQASAFAGLRVCIGVD
jgi:formylglycine-generating enzyme required for sulfatase activity